ncbi:uncharacterized protein LOC110449345 isoform X1 [Mizuhopecten yessoensis]|uniref:uncharacterized protein LOC110449345 isoform X1 n=1 Tax=Mizuhopecten yessoensis TaxID=6573 RepID=UPI000B458287|nr:uncharacterized protein LOC110449345 isoform X1 [Mizuhopecten yessoensis]
MFRATAEKFTKSVSSNGDTFIPVESITSAHDLKLLQIVVKEIKRHCIFFKKVTYKPYNFELSDVLLNSHVPMHVDENTQEGFCKWHRTIELSLSGKFGVAILEELADVTLSSSDTVNIEANLGQLNLVKLNSASLEQGLIKRRIDLSHVLIEQIRFKRKRVLCVVQSIVKLAQDAEVKRTDKIDIGGGINTRVPVCCIQGGSESSVSATGSIIDDTIGDIGLLKAQPIAYKVWELQVDKYGGGIVPCITEDIPGGFMNKEDIIGRPPIPASTIDVNNTDGLETDGAGPGTVARISVSGPVDPPDKVCRILKPLFSMPEIQREKINDLLFHASTEDFEKLDILFDQVENRFHDPNTEDKLSFHGISDLKFKDQDICCNFLTLAGFELKEDENKMTSPAACTPAFEACCHLMEAMTELPEDVMSLVRGCKSSLCPTLLHVIEQFLNGRPMVELTRYVEELARDPMGMELLNTLNIKVDMERKNPLIARDGGLNECVDELYWWLCATHMR